MPLLTKKKMAATALTTTANTVVYTAPATGAIIKEIIISNTTGSANTVSLQIAGVNVLAGKAVPVNDCIVFALSTVLNSGDTVQAWCSAASANTIFISGVEG